MPPIAYLTGRYPAISHSFIVREVRALRGLGVDVRTLSIWAPKREHLLASVDREEAARTYSALPPRISDFATANALALASGPARYLGTLVYALRLGTGGWRHRVRQAFHFTEAVLLWRRCRAMGIRHVHAHFNSNSADAALLVTRLGGAGWSWSFTIHGSAEFDDPDASALDEKIRTARFVVCVSDHGRAQLTARTPRSGWGKLRLVHCGVDVEEFRAGSARRERGADDLQILTVGRLVPLKGQGVLMRAVGELRRRGVPTRLTIVGDGPERESLELLSREAGVADRVILLGAVGQDDIRCHYARADVFCLPSFSEGLPVVLMEAMAMELPVVATDVAGIPELVEDERSGLLVPPARADLLADALEELASDPERRSAMGAAGRRKILADFRLESSAQQLRLLFAGLDRPVDSARVPHHNRSQPTATGSNSDA